RVSTRKANRRHGCLGSGVYHSHFFHRRDHRTYQLGHLHLSGCWSSERRGVGKGIAHCALYSLMRVSQYHGSPRINQVDIFITILIVEECTLRFFDEQRCTSHCAEGAYWRIYSSRNKLLSLFEKLFTLGNLSHHNNVPDNKTRLLAFDMRQDSTLELDKWHNLIVANELVSESLE